MSHPYFNTSLRRDPSQPRDLIARVDAEVRDRIAEAIDFVCLEALVESRSAQGLPAPAPDSTRDRTEFETRVETFLGRLGDELSQALTEEQRPALAAAAGRAGTDRLEQLIAMQVALAKLLPDYWQRFEVVRVAYAAGATDAGPGSGRNRPSWLSRLLGG